MMSRVKFGDLELNNTQKAQLKDFETQIENVKKAIESLKGVAKADFLAGDIGKLYSDLDPAAATRSFEDIGKRIDQEVDK